LYVSSEQLVKGDQMFVTWDYKGVDVKYLSYAFEGICFLDAINMPKDLFYENMPKEFHVYDTQDKITSTQYDHK
jgi:hypothetical protein